MKACISQEVGERGGLFLLFIMKYFNISQEFGERWNIFLYN